MKHLDKLSALCPLADLTLILRRLHRIDLRTCVASLSLHASLVRQVLGATWVAVSVLEEDNREGLWTLAECFACESTNTSTKLAALVSSRNYERIASVLDHLNPVSIAYLDDGSMDLITSVAISVEGVRIGCLAARIPSITVSTFESTHQSTLRHIAACASDVLQSQVHLSDQLILGWTGLMVGVTHNLRTPLSIVALSVSEAAQSLVNIQTKYAHLIDIEDLKAPIDNCRDAEIAASQLQLVIEANSDLGCMILAYEAYSPQLMRQAMVHLNRSGTYAMISRIRKRLLVMEDNHSIQWFVNENSSNENERIHLTYSDAIEQCLASAVAQFMVQHAEISVFIDYESAQESTAQVTLDASESLHISGGFVSVEITFQVEANSEDVKQSVIGSEGHMLKEDNISTQREFDTFSQRFELQLIERLLKVLGGRIAKLSTKDGRSGRLVLHFPCQFISIESLEPNDGLKGSDSIKSTDDVRSSYSDTDLVKTHLIIDTIRNETVNYLLDEERINDDKLNLSRLGKGFQTIVAEEKSSLQLSEEIKSNEPIIKALIIEDGIPVQKILTSWLRKRGCEVHTALNGKIGLEKMVAQIFQIVFCDFLMPVQDGVTTMQLYQKYVLESKMNESTTIPIPLIVGVSATANKEDLLDAFRYGMNYFCQKPLAPDVLDFIVTTYQNCNGDLNLINVAMEEKSNELSQNGKNMSVVSSRTFELMKF